MRELGGLEGGPATAAASGKVIDPRVGQVLVLLRGEASDHEEDVLIHGEEGMVGHRDRQLEGGEDKVLALELLGRDEEARLLGAAARDYPSGGVRDFFALLPY